MVNEHSNLLSKQLLYLQQRQFLGIIEIKSNTGKSWKIYFCLGRLVWIQENCDAHRSLQRHLAQYCQQIDPRLITIDNVDKIECRNYYILSVLLKRKIITKEQAIVIIQNIISEILFDIFQEERIQCLKYTIERKSGKFLMQSGLKMSLGIITYEQTVEKSYKSCLAWCEQGFEHWSPNLAPILKQPEQIKKEVTAKAYQKFVRLMNGKNTLRDLAFKLNRNLLELTSLIAPYIRRGLLELIDISELPKTKITNKSVPVAFTPQKLTNETQPLVVCIDDSKFICNIMEQIVSEAGYRFMGIQDDLRAISLLIKYKPDLIFLDLNMPIVNGYEICNQLRRVSILRNIPVIMLTGNDGIIDRMRAKLVGTSSFLSKPIKSTKIIKILDKFLPIYSLQVDHSISSELDSYESVVSGFNQYGTREKQNSKYVAC